jgi:hypothetical protein
MRHVVASLVVARTVPTYEQLESRKSDARTDVQRGDTTRRRWRPRSRSRSDVWKPTHAAG